MESWFMSVCSGCVGLYNELKEVRVLRKHLLDDAMSGNHNRGEVAKLDLAPEAAALDACLITLHKKLNI
jgi:hypothetical protein